MAGRVVSGGAGTVSPVSNRQQQAHFIDMDNGGFPALARLLGQVFLQRPLVLIRSHHHRRRVVSRRSPFLPGLWNLLIRSNSWIIATNIPGLSIFVSSNAVIESWRRDNGQPRRNHQRKRRRSYSVGAEEHMAAMGARTPLIGIGGGQAFGNPFAPVSPGGNGAPVGPSQGGGGGPALRITVNGSLLINGSISSDGQNGISANSGGGLAEESGLRQANSRVMEPFRPMADAGMAQVVLAEGVASR